MDTCTLDWYWEIVADGKVKGIKRWQVKENLLYVFTYVCECT